MPHRRRGLVIPLLALLISGPLPRQALRAQITRPGKLPRAPTLAAEVQKRRGIIDLTCGHSDIGELIRESDTGQVVWDE